MAAISTRSSAPPMSRSKLGEREQALQILSAVLGRATAAWRGTAAIKLGALGRCRREVGDRRRSSISIAPVAAPAPPSTRWSRPRACRSISTTRRDMRLRAAQLATVELGDNAAAIDMYRSVLAPAPNDLEVIDRLAHLLGVEDRVPELLTLRQIQLGLETDIDKKLDAAARARASLVGIVEERGGRLDALKREPRGPPRSRGVDRRGRRAARRARASTAARRSAREPGPAARDRRRDRRAPRSCGRATRSVAETRHQGNRARDQPATAASSRSRRRASRCARSRGLNLERGQSGAGRAVARELARHRAGRRAPASSCSQLAKAHLSANQPDRAIAAIEVNLDDKDAGDRAAHAARRPLPQGRAVGAARAPPDAQPAAAQGRRSSRASSRARPSQLYLTQARLAGQGDPGARDRARSSIRPTRTCAPRSRSASASPASSPRRAPLLAELITDFGRRRSPERAALHVELARVAQAEGKLDEAMSEMESASKMDVSNAAIQKELAEMARTAGQLDKAERTYRALLLVVRRTPPGDDEAAVGAERGAVRAPQARRRARRGAIRRRSCSSRRWRPRSSPTPRCAACAAA